MGVNKNLAKTEPLVRETQRHNASLSPASTLFQIVVMGERRILSEVVYSFMAMIVKSISERWTKNLECTLKVKSFHNFEIQFVNNE